jgi:hypothetical protein
LLGLRRASFPPIWQKLHQPMEVGCSHASAGNRTRGWPNHLRLMATVNFTTKPPMLDGGRRFCQYIFLHKHGTILGKDDRSIFRLIRRSPGLIRHSVRLALERHVTTERFWTIGKWMAVFGIRYYLASGGRTLVYTKAIRTRREEADTRRSLCWDELQIRFRDPLLGS